MTSPSTRPPFRSASSSRRPRATTTSARSTRTRSTSTRTGPGPPTTNCIVSGRHNDAVYGINFDAETVDWKLGGTTTADSLTIVGDPLGGPRRQHDVRVLPNGHITMFDNRTNFTTATVPFATVTGAARFVEYAIDETANTATLVRRDQQPERVLLRRNRQRSRAARWWRRHLLGCAAGHRLLGVRRGRSGRVRSAHARAQLELPHGEGAARIVRHRRVAADGGRVTGGSIAALPALPASARRVARARARALRQARRLHAQVGSQELVVPRHQADRVPTGRHRAGRRCAARRRPG